MFSAIIGERDWLNLAGRVCVCVCVCASVCVVHHLPAFVEEQTAWTDPQTLQAAMGSSRLSPQLAH